VLTTNAGTRRLVRAAAMVAFCLVAASVAVDALAATKTHTVTMEGTRFIPETLTVRRGDRVVWINKDPFPHTATGPTRSFDSRSVAPEASWRYVAKKAGTFPYVCTFHPTMKGTLVVE